MSNRRMVLLLVCGILAATATAPTPSRADASADTTGTESAHAEKLFMLEYGTGPAWRSDVPFHEQAHASKHSGNLARMRREVFTDELHPLSVFYEGCLERPGETP